MDDRRFDDLTRAISEGTSRRAMLKGVIGGSLTALLAAIGLGEADAQELETDARCGRCRRIKNRRRRRRCSSRCRRGGRGGGGGGGTTAAPQPISTNAAGAGIGAPCTEANDCLIGTVCNGGVCAACTTACPAGSTTTCCAVGICQVVGGSDVCVLG